ncbi:MAG: spore germination protein, partial [Sporomusaceae bacterium]|nr:spore germination protein [Sporomusaceae bacterium]
MGKDISGKMFTNIKNLLVYQPSRSPDPFVLDETQEDKSKQDGEPPTIPLAERAREMELMLNCAKSLAVFA